MSKKKALRRLPELNDLVELRGRGNRGIISRISQVSKWANVDWHLDNPGPKIVHLDELQIINEN